MMREGYGTVYLRANCSPGTEPPIARIARHESDLPMRARASARELLLVKRDRKILLC
jgi:hypothetical protein